MGYEDIIDTLKRRFRNAAGQISGEATPVIAGHLSAEKLASRTLLKPQMDVFENDEEIRILMDLPGGAPENTFIHRESRGTISVYVRRKSVADNEQRLEGVSRPTDWYRLIELPEYGKASESTGAIRRGILTLRVPKRHKPAPMGIPVDVKS